VSSAVRSNTTHLFGAFDPKADMSSVDALKAALKSNLQGVRHLEVLDLSDGCGSKFDAVIVADGFEGVALLDRQRMVHAALKDEMKKIHALTMKVPLSRLAGSHLISDIPDDDADSMDGEGQHAECLTKQGNRALSSFSATNPFPMMQTFCKMPSHMLCQFLLQSSAFCSSSFILSLLDWPVCGGTMIANRL
jgi:stress-induced morphogen